MKETTPVSRGYAPHMVTDGPIPFVPYLCGALAATALVAWTKAKYRNWACNVDPAPTYGLGQLLLFTLLVLAGVWLIVVGGEGALGGITVCFSSFVLMSADERQRCLAESRTRSIRPWEVAICLLLMATVFILIGLVIFNDGRPPDFSPATRSLWSRFQDGAKVVRHAIGGAFVVFVADAILSAWGRWFAFRRGSPTPRSR